MRLKTLLLFLFLTTPVFADGPYYVDNTASGSNNGSSWTDAWESFGSINWSSVAAGTNRTVYISGGASTKTYTEGLTIGASGTSGNPIIITVGAESPHNGTVIITGGEYVGISVSGKNYITIDGQSNNDGQRHIEITDNYGLISAVSVSGNSTYIITKYLYIHAATKKDGDSYTSINYAVTSTTYAVGHEIAYNYITDNVDCIHIGDTGGTKPSSYGGFLIHHNTLSCYDDQITTDGNADIYNNDISSSCFGATCYIGHPDGIQCYGSYVRIYNNYFHGFHDRDGGNSVIYWEPDGDNNMNVNNNQPSNFYIYNNVLWETGDSSHVQAITLAITDGDFTAVSNVGVLNNTISGKYSAGIWLTFTGSTLLDTDSVSNIVIANNILTNALDASTHNIDYTMAIDLRSVSGLTIGAYGSESDIMVDSNIYYGTGATHIDRGGSAQTVSTFNSTYSANMIASDPSLNVSHAPDSADDPPVNAGVDLSSLIVAVDKTGNTRTGTWDIGAYEYGSSIPVTTIPQGVHIGGGIEIK